jgi:response regulator RpfG family c-di-GMP phosphodiesterase
MSDKSSSPTLLVVDDEPLVLSSLERLFKADFQVFKADNGPRAIEIMQSERIDVLISDQRMPGMTGVQVLERAREISPATMRILLTGYADLEAVRGAVNAGEVFRYLTKPWSNSVLRETVKACLNAAYASSAEIALLKTTQAVEVPTGSILILDNDLVSAKKITEAIGPGYQIHVAQNLAAATRILDSDPHIWLMISEVRVQGEEIAEFLSVLKSVSPALISIAVSSIQDANMVIRLINEGQIMRFLGKPIDSTRVRQAVGYAQVRHRQVKLSAGMRSRFAVETSSRLKTLQEELRQDLTSDVSSVKAVIAQNSIAARAIENRDSYAPVAVKPFAIVPPIAKPESMPNKEVDGPGIFKRIFSLFSR